MIHYGQQQYLHHLYDWTRQLHHQAAILHGESREGTREEQGNHPITVLLRDIERAIAHPQQANNATLQAMYERANDLYQTVSVRESEPKTVPLKPVPYGEHQLPPLPYPYNALEPYISEDIMKLHHQEHHKSYVDGLNKAEREMAEARRTGNFDLIRHWEREAAFNGAGHYLHTIFWFNMHPDGGGEPTGELSKQMNQSFGSFARFKRHFTEAAKEVEGVGWAFLVWAPRSHRLEILQAEKHQHFSQQDVIPLLTLDVWEHAYYLQYPNKRGEYIDNWWNVVNWADVNRRFLEAQRLRWQSF